MKHIQIALFVATLVLTTAHVSSAAVPPILREGTHPFWFGFGMGPAIALVNSPNQYLLTQTFGYHFMGDASGPAIAVDVQEHVFGNLFVFQLGGRFVWDIRIVPNLGFYLSPSVGLGYTFSSAPNHGLTIPFAFKAKLILGNRGFVFFQPFCMDLMTFFRPQNEYVALQYDILFGGGVIF